MKRQLYSFVLVEVFILILALLITFIQFSNKKIADESKTVFVKKTNDGFILIRNGKPFYIQGAAGNTHFKELAEIGGNTIRLYDTVNLGTTLNEAAKYGLAAIVDIPIPVNRFNIYMNESSRQLIQKTRSFINKYKDHPALLMWNLGNEVNFPTFSWKYFFKPNHFINTFNELIDIVHKEDPNHPVSTSLWNTTLKQLASIRIFSPTLDLYSFNVFADIKNVNLKIVKFFNLFTPVPYYMSEFGSDGYWESKNTTWLAPIEQTSTKKVEQINDRYRIIKQDMNKNCLGALIFFWGYKYEHTYSWFSLFMDGHKSEIIKELKFLWKKSPDKPSLIGLNYMLVNGKGGASDIIFAPNQLAKANLIFLDNKNSNNDSLRFKWEIYPEGWHYDEDDMFVRPKSLEDILVTTEKDKATFRAPSKEGPYRIFVYVYDKNGYFATTNTPFYVLNPK